MDPDIYSAEMFSFTFSDIDNMDKTFMLQWLSKNNRAKDTCSLNI